MDEQYNQYELEVNYAQTSWYTTGCEGNSKNKYACDKNNVRSGNKDYCGTGVLLVYVQLMSFQHGFQYTYETSNDRLFIRDLWLKHVPWQKLYFTS